ncbi:hypothetical protein D9M71_649480 [compost metagenome]
MHGVGQQVIDFDALQQPLGILAHRAQIRRFTGVHPIGLELVRLATQGFGGLLQDQAKLQAASVVHQHQAGAGALHRRLAKAQGGKVDDRNQLATMGEDARDPGRCLGDRLERLTRQHFDHLVHAQGKTLRSDAKLQVQRPPGVRRPRGAQLQVVHRGQTLKRDTPPRRPAATWLSSSMA